ncbi:MAG TPA: hypothetical protein VG225_03465 [Terracidiphilus sp.]|jgi:hypothetical protein|nr:hypothetical protein [Terracidiphilus sp.]
MSGVLERMAKQAMGALPTVQPLTAPHYAAPERGARESMWAPEMNLEVESPAYGVQPMRLSHRDRSDFTAPQHRERAEVGPSSAEDRSARKPAPPGNGASADAADSESNRRIETSAKASPAQKNNVAQEPPQPANENPTHSSSSRGITTPAQRESRIDALPLFPFHEDAVPRVVHPAQEVRAIRAMPRETQEPIRPAARMRREAPEEPKPEPTTEIHISIGSVELRAARQEPSPQAVPFRPRVALNDFLRRKPEAGA